MSGRGGSTDGILCRCLAYARPGRSNTCPCTDRTGKTPQESWKKDGRNFLMAWMGLHEGTIFLAISSALLALELEKSKSETGQDRLGGAQAKRHQLHYRYTKYP